MALRVSRRVLEEIAGHARQSAPQECCGILLAIPPGSTVTALLRGENVTPRPAERYELDHRTQLRALDLEIEGLADVVGYYHSHPRGSSRPSPHDIRESVPGSVYLICGLAGKDPTFAAWRRTEAGLTPCPLEVLDGNHDGK